MVPSPGSLISACMFWSLPKENHPMTGTLPANLCPPFPSHLLQGWALTSSPGCSFTSQHPVTDFQFHHVTKVILTMVANYPQPQHLLWNIISHDVCGLMILVTFPCNSIFLTLSLPWFPGSPLMSFPVPWPTPTGCSSLGSVSQGLLSPFRWLPTESAGTLLQASGSPSCFLGCHCHLDFSTTSSSKNSTWTCFPLYELVFPSIGLLLCSTLLGWNLQPTCSLILENCR